MILPNPQCRLALTWLVTANKICREAQLYFLVLIPLMPPVGCCIICALLSGSYMPSALSSPGVVEPAVGITAAAPAAVAASAIEGPKVKLLRMELIRRACFK